MFDEYSGWWRLQVFTLMGPEGFGIMLKQLETSRRGGKRAWIALLEAVAVSPIFLCSCKRSLDIIMCSQPAACFHFSWGEEFTSHLST